MEIISEPAAMQDWSRSRRQEGQTIGLVPTMGFFHQGHLALMRLAAQRCDQVVVSLFVNPTQFGPDEDLEAYPRNLERDRQLAADTGVSLLFTPEATAMYPPGHQTRVEVTGMTRHLCGASRPGHFTGVTTVVCKLLNLVAPDVAVFGEKDFQQLMVIRRMVADLNMPVEIVAHPVVRESDGLAMSSRNTYLTPAQRPAALSLVRGIRRAQELVAAGERQTARLHQEVTRLIRAQPETSIDYVAFVDGRTLEPVQQVNAYTRILLAVRLGDRIRLIDNDTLGVSF